MPGFPPARAALAAAMIALSLAGCSTSAAPETHATDTAASPTFITDERIDDAALRILGVYEVDGTQLVGDVDPKYAAVWTRFTELVDVAAWPQITLFAALDRDASPLGTEGAVSTLATNPLQYYVALDVTGVQTPAALDSTMIHEFAHLVTLRPEQVPIETSDPESCPVFEFNGRCAVEGSYFRAWLEQFWPGMTEAEFDIQSESAASDRYATGEFVSEYAATAPYEDIAETFDAWVRESSEPTGDTVLDDKLRFFDDYPEAVSLKTYAREALDG